ncbi:hypothetical protein [Halobacterium rubrum]|uniref:hypothetical protein n=1 Tax=Halobacterium TaxID=2239 RepID=UPI001F1CAB0C|nr:MULTISPECIES: hypothetical protein [Halobacterium]MDH5019235.1 hypothetical protein [Halobacterium rubrum]
MRRKPATLLVRALQAGIAAIVVVGVATRNVAVVVNGVLGLAVTFLPVVLRRDYHLWLSPGASLLVAVAVFLHAAGMLGAYDTVWWFDHLTHGLSAAVVAAAGYAAARALDEHRDDLHFPRSFLTVFIFLLTLALGVLWEVAEWAAREAAVALALDPVLVVYGVEDTVFDVVFNAVGALLAATLGARYLRADIDAVGVWLDE